MKRVTVEDIVATVDELYPNTYERKEKERWISDVEREIKQNIILTHYDPDEKRENELYAFAPYHEIYTYYVEAQIDKNNGEYDRYSNHMALYNNLYAEFEAYYHRNHMPVQHCKFKLV